MKLQLSQTISAQNTDLVLRELEICLRDTATDVARSGNQLTAFGIGPSHRTKNHKDKAILEVRLERDLTVVQVDATFQASALLGDQPQDSVVRSKFEMVFSCLRAQLSAYSGAPISLSKEIQTSPGSVVQASFTRSAEPIDPPESQPISLSGTPAAPVKMPLPNSPRHRETHKIQKFQKVQEIQEVQKIQEDLELPAVDRIPPVHPSPGSLSSYAEPKHSTPIWVILVCPAILCMLLVPVLRQRYRWHTAKTSNSARVSPPENSQVVKPSFPQPATDKVNSPSQSSFPQASTLSNPQTEPAPSEASTATVFSRGPNSSLRQRLEDWGVALRSRDAAAQAAFYSSRVHPYLKNQDVDNKFVLHDKQASIRRRQGLWTIKLEEIKVENETPSTARVHLIKHVMDEANGAPVKERSVPSQLHLKRVGGQWYITAERDLP